MKVLFVAWQNPDTRQWFTIGRLTSDTAIYQFCYTQGVYDAQRSSGFCPLPSFPDLGSVYEAQELFPVFTNRILPKSRPDYGEFIQWLALSEQEDDPMAMLARSGGRRATDTLALFPCPELNSEGKYHIHFFVHGLGHASGEAISRAERLQMGEQLLVMQDVQNPMASQALALRTAEVVPGDMFLLGYFPQYLLNDLHHLLTHTPDPKTALIVIVERLNLPPAPVQFRVLCNLTMQWPDSFQPFSSSAYLPYRQGL